MSEELSEENLGLIDKLGLTTIDPQAGRYYTAKQLNRLLDAARAEGRRTPPADRSVREADQRDAIIFRLVEWIEEEVGAELPLDDPANIKLAREIYCRLSPTETEER